MKVLPFGDRAILAEFDTLGQAMRAFRALATERAPGVVELVPAACTVLARVDPSLLSLRAAEQWLTDTCARAARGESVREPAPERVTVPVRYDGLDLAATAELLGITPDELVSRHSQAEWQCAFIGFAPGFAYLASEYSNFDIPRRETSREAVPAGSVGLAGEFTGIYPRTSPGGWQLIGTTEMVLWDESSETPAAITPGISVRFEVIEP